ncbi:MAG: winged helix-turn-helix transcriptional regulator, partial [Candidatus Lokiarchaeota archaeon]
MALKKPSSEMKDEILTIAKDMSNDMMILFILKNLGPQRFSDLLNLCDISRTTIAKYLKFHTKKKYIEKKIHKKDPHYFITSQGIEKLKLDRGQSGKDISYISKLNELTTQISDMIDFYEEIA